MTKLRVNDAVRNRRPSRWEQTEQGFFAVFVSRLAIVQLGASTCKLRAGCMDLSKCAMALHLHATCLNLRASVCKIACKLACNCHKKPTCRRWKTPMEGPVGREKEAKGENKK